MSLDTVFDRFACVWTAWLMWQRRVFPSCVPREIDRMKSFKRGWTAINENPNRTIDLAKSTVNAIVDSLHKSKKQIIFVPSSNEDLITNLLIALKAVKDDFDFILVGLPTWYNFETIDPMLLQQ